MGAYETSLYHAILITAFILGCMIVYFAVSVFRQQRKYIQLQRKYFTDEINALEEERSRIARDLHDEVGPLLSLTQWHLSEVESSDEKKDAHIDKAAENLGKLMRRMGEISVNLTPNLLVRKGLRYTLEKFFEDVEEASSLNIKFTWEVNSLPEAERSIHLYRIVQEIIHNTLKHAKARYVLIHFKEKNDKIYLLCKDDGIGFEAERINGKRMGLGLNSLESRAVLLNGKIKCISKPKYGTEYFFEFPTRY